MRPRVLFVLAATAALSACLPPGPAGEPSGPEQSDAPPAAERCESAPTSGAIGDAIMMIDPPEGTIVRSVMELPSAHGDGPAEVDVVVSLCGPALTEDVHRQVATDAAIAASDTPTAGDILDFTVHSYADTGNGLLGLERNLGVFDYQDHPWADAASSARLDAVWGDRAVS